MLDQELIINVVVGILAYKGCIALIEFFCIRILSIFLDKKITGTRRKQRVEDAIRLANEKLREAES